MKYFNITLVILIFLVGACTPGEKHQGSDQALALVDTVKVNISEDIVATDRKVIDDSTKDIEENALSPSDHKLSDAVPIFNILKRKENPYQYNGESIEKITYTVSIPEKYNESQLKTIAEYLMNRESDQANIFIEYYLDSQNPSGLNYGLSSRVFGVKENIINYTSPAEETFDFNAVLTGTGKYVIGKWKYLENILILYQKDNNYYGIFCWGTDSYNGPFDYIKTKYRGKTAYYNPDAPEEKLVLESNGDLGVYVGGKKINTCRTLK